MPTDPHSLTVSEAVRRAVDVVDPNGANDGVTDLARRFEDHDEPIRSINDIDELMDEMVRRIDVDAEDDDPALTMAGAIVTYLHYRRDAINESDERLLEEAAKSEFNGHPPPAVQQFLEGL